MIDKKREEIQSKAVEAWVENGMVGTIEMHTRNAEKISSVLSVFNYCQKVLIFYILPKQRLDVKQL